MIGIINYDAGNIRSIQNALERMGIGYIISDNKAALNQCEKIIFPGVGSARSAMQSLRKNKLINWIQNCEKPFLGICLGMQLLFEFSQEGNTQGLGIIPGRVYKFEQKMCSRVTHIGWNQIKSLNLKEFDHPYVYFVHSYFVPVNDFTVATTQYEDQIFSAIVRKDNFWGLQFHPEKSQKAGEQLLLKFLES